MTQAPDITPAEEHASRRIAAPALVGGAFALVLLSLFVVLAVGQRALLTSTFDASLASVIHGWRSETLTPWVILATNLGAAVVVVPVIAAAALVALVFRRWAAAILVVTVLALGYAWATLAQELIARTRPPQLQALIKIPAAYSYPSGHTNTAILVYGVLGFLIWRLAPRMWERVLGVTVCALLIVTVGVSRVYLGVHWPTDVLGGWLLGGAWLALMAGAYLTWERFASSRAATRSPRATTTSGTSTRAHSAP